MDKTLLLKQFRKARSVSTPLIAITTPDPAATVQGIRDIYTDAVEAPAILLWDIARGIIGVNDEGIAAQKALGGDGIGIGNPPVALNRANELPEDAILFLANGHRYLEASPVIQALWNLRDAFKENGRTLVLLCPQVTLPAELSHDVLILDESLPEVAELEQIITKQYEAGRESCETIPALNAETLSRATDAVMGLAAYPAESAVALSLTSSGIDFDGLWERKRRMVEQTPGLTIYRGRETFEQVAGLINVKEFILRLIGGKRKPRAVVWLDEIEKMLAGFGAGGQGDSSGTSQDQMGQLLQWMQDHNARGLLFIGFPGSGKSLIAKATGNACGVPTIQMDLGAMKGSLVGQSEERIRAGLKVANAVGQGEVLVIATCNSIGNLPPELRRRFKRGTFFFDLPNADERTAAWLLHARRNDIDLNATTVKLINFDEGWTGAEIETCCEIASELGLSLEEASRYVVPVAKSMGEQITALREQANGRYISASVSGVYELAEQSNKPAPRGTRKLTVSD